VTFGTNTEIAALLLIIAVHVLGAVVLIWGMIDRDDPDRGSWRDWWPRGDDEAPAGPDPEPSSGGMPAPVLPQSVIPSARVREGGRIGDLTPRPARRPEHPPVPRRMPTPHER